MHSDHESSFLKMFQESSPPQTTPSDALSPRWWEEMPHSFRQEPLAGGSRESQETTLAGPILVWLVDDTVVRLGQYSTVNFSESRNGGGVCSLSSILETEVPAKYYLSAKACRGILRRAKKRGKELPIALMNALMDVAQSLDADSQPEKEDGAISITKDGEQAGM
jgi:hypothetical protein